MLIYIGCSKFAFKINRPNFNDPNSQIKIVRLLSFPLNQQAYTLIPMSYYPCL